MAQNCQVSNDNCVEKDKHLEQIKYIGYMNFIRYITPIIIHDLNERGWTEHSKNKIGVRFMANNKWWKLSDTERVSWQSNNNLSN